MAAIFARLSGPLAARHGPGVVGGFGALVFMLGSGVLWILLIGVTVPPTRSGSPTPIISQQRGAPSSAAP